MPLRDPASAPDDLFDAIAKLLDPSQREYFYHRMLYFRQLRPDDEQLRLVEAIGFLALVIREAPPAIAIEREQIVHAFATRPVSIRARSSTVARAASACRARVRALLTLRGRILAAAPRRAPRSRAGGRETCRRRLWSASGPR